MRLINQKVTEIKQQFSSDKELNKKYLFEHIERCGRNCYKSENSIKADSAEKFVKALINRGHVSVLGHGMVYVKSNIEDTSFNEQDAIFSPYSRHWEIDDVIYAAVNYRTIIEENAESLLEKAVPPEKNHQQALTVMFTTSIGIAREIDRHNHSISEESTRYCNYLTDRFENELTFIKPEAFRNKRDDDTDVIILSNSLSAIEFEYTHLTNCLKCGNDMSRNLLPLETKTDSIHTTFISNNTCHKYASKGWEDFVRQRSSKYAHEDVRYLADEVKRIISRNDKK